MSNLPVQHAGFTITREYDATPARVFAAFADKGAKMRWFGGTDDGWEVTESSMDFREGGREIWRGGMPGKFTYANTTIYQDIVPNQRLIYSYEMRVGEPGKEEARISVSLASIEFQALGKGTRLVLTEQDIFLDGLDTSAQREEGTRELLASLDKYLKSLAST
jgi:uncharacterized protein YndB with AHSA1/START domain